jgi:colanic acid/amylovoran biosynthesis glycosyltransferase
MQINSDNERAATEMAAPEGEGSVVTSGLLLDLPVPFRRIDGVLYVDAQAHNGIQRWLDNFRQVTVCAPCVPDELIDPSVSWLPADDLLRRDGFRLHDLPWGYHPFDHLRHRARVRALYRGLIADHEFLCFSNLGWAGAWGSIAAREASRQRRPYAVWLDWVLHEMHPTRSGNQVKGALNAVRDWLETRHALTAIKQAGLGLFHGRTVYDAYAPISRNPHVVHNVHLKRDDVIPRAELRERLERSDATVRIGYVGRVHDMKGPLQWIDAMENLSRQHPGRVQAVWLGDGPLLEECRRQVTLRGLDGCVSFPGGERHRPKVLAFLRSLDLFAFCHLTQESPRCLIEALMSGVPLVGYDSAYARDLVAPAGGGDFVPIGDVAGLAARLSALLTDAQARRAVSIAAIASGERFSDDAVFAHRSELIKRHLAQSARMRPAAESDSSFGPAVA